MNNKDLGVHLGKTIKDLRKLKKLRQQELARLSGISQAQISKIEDATHSPSIDTLACIAEALGVTIVKLFTKANKNAN